MTCSECENPNPDGSRFCGTCGKALCPKCGTVVAGSPAFCSACGQPLRHPVTARPSVPLQTEAEWDPFAAPKQPSGPTGSRPSSSGPEPAEPAPKSTPPLDASKETTPEQGRIINGERSRRWPRFVAFVAAVLFATLGFYLLQVHTRTSVIPISGGGEMMPSTPQGSDITHTFPHEPKPHVRLGQTQTITIQRQVNYQKPGLISLLASLVCLFVARPGAGRGPGYSRIYSAKYRWGSAVTLIVLVYVAGMLFPLHDALEQATLLRYVAIAAAIFIATLSPTARAAPSEMADGNVQEEYVAGRVRNFEKRSEGGGQIPLSIWTFLLEAYDDKGNALQPVPVEIRSRFIKGVLADGHLVEIPGRYQQGASLTPKTIFNRTTQSWIGTDSDVKNSWGQLIFVVLFPLIGFPLLVGILYLVIRIIMAFTGQR